MTITSTIVITYCQAILTSCGSVHLSVSVMETHCQYEGQVTPRKTASHLRDVVYCMSENNDKCVFKGDSQNNSKSSITLFSDTARNGSLRFIKCFLGVHGKI